jgi:beta-lactamase class A
MSDLRLLRDVREELTDAGLRASIVVRDIDTGDEIALDGDIPTPAASLAKLPLALAVLDGIETGRIDGAATVRVAPGFGTSPGTGMFRHDARIAVADLVSLAITISDNGAADSLFELVPPAEVMAYLGRIGVRGLNVRQPFGELWDTPLEQLQPQDAHLAHTLAIHGSTPASGHPVRQLDIARTNTGTAAAWADLLQILWRGEKIEAAAAATLREHLRNNVFRQRLAPEFLADDARWASKTGTVLNLRHEAGVVEHAGGSRIAVVALSTSMVPATQQPAAEATLGAAARRMHDALRSTRRAS